MKYDTQKNPFDGKWYVVKLSTQNRPIPIAGGYVLKMTAFRKMKVMENNQKYTNFR